MQLKKEDATKVLDRLASEYPQAACALEHRNAYQLLVAVTLSAQTTDVSVNKVTRGLFEKYPDPYAMADADAGEIEKLIKTIGLYKTKSKRIIEQANMLCEKYKGTVPEDDQELQKLPGVGRKTANVVMADAFGHQRIAVDTHVFRVANRIGLADGKNVEETEDMLKRILPEER